uniref:RNA-directed DNA polymerase, eukaryota n=1 Tax=Tanacetum cinerariifolium TaxID=118510 RepID=A0A6L2MZG6_TANCI|nr:RNA-directed DNA polymerase, eukaryota [Tanacetum cinerariifolium]
MNDNKESNKRSWNEARVGHDSLSPFVSQGTTFKAVVHPDLRNLLEISRKSKKHRRTNDDDVFKISKSVYVTNFPESTSARDLWKTCSVYGTVVDVFIPSKTSKAGKRFAFVRFVKVFNLDRLVENLCTNWIGSFHLFANKVRFERPHKPNETPNANSGAPSRIPKLSITQHSNSRVGSYANIVNGVSSGMQNSLISTLPALVLDDTCLVDRDLSNHAMGKVLFEFNKMAAKHWQEMGRDIRFRRYADTSFGHKCLCVKTKHVVSILETFKVIIKGKVFMVRAKELFTWNPTFLVHKEKEYTSEDESIHESINNKFYHHPNKEELGNDYASDEDGVPETVFGSISSSHKQDNGDKDVTHSEDPFGLYDLLKNKKAIQETKMTRVSNMDVKFLWGNSNYDYVCSDSLGSSGGILCIWEALVFKKDNVTVSNNFIAIYGTWLPSNSKILFVAIYAPQQVSCKKNLWDYISIIVGRWNGETIIMGDFNEVRSSDERRGVRVYMGSSLGFKMSKLDSFLGSDGILSLFPSITALCLDRHLSDHRPILLREIQLDFGPTPFRFYHSWFDYAGFDDMIKLSWRSWVKAKRQEVSGSKNEMISKLGEIDKVMDHGKFDDSTVFRRFELKRKLLNVTEMEAKDRFLKSKVKWAIEGDDNSKFFHDIINKRRSQLAICGIFVDEKGVSRDEIRRAVWSCGDNISLGLDGYTFEFFKKYLDLIGSDFCDAVEYFFVNGSFPKGCNSSFVALIRRLAPVIVDLIFDTQSAFVAGRQILDGPFILDEILHWCKRKKKQAMFFKVDFDKAYDSVRWDYLLEVLEAFGFGQIWCNWIRGTLNFAKASIMINESPSKEFSCYRGLKQRDPLTPYLFILIMESLHLSFSWVVDEGLFKGVMMGECSSNLKAWDDIILKLRSRLSKWKVKTLSIGFSMEWINRIKKVTWAAWNKVLASKKHGGLGVSSFFALNRALLLKWVWRFISQDGYLWYQGKVLIFGLIVKNVLGMVMTHGSGSIGDIPLRDKFPRLFALELDKEAPMAVKLNAPIEISFCRNARGGLEQHLMANMNSMLDSVVLLNSGDRWVCDLASDDNFRVKEVCNFIDDLFLPRQAVPTRWVKFIPIKVNIFAWQARQDCLPTRVNLVRKGINIESSTCLICSSCEEDVNHIFFCCNLAQHVLRRICRWWGLDPNGWTLFQEWQAWLLSIRFSSKVKTMLEGIFFVAWWCIWSFRNRFIFEDSPLRRSEIFDDIVFCAFNWCNVEENAGISVNKPDHSMNSLNNGGISSHSRVKRSFNLKSGGSIMDVIENLAEIGQTMGYNMEGCKRNLEDIVASHGDSQLESIDLFSIKKLWGNLSFEFSFSPSVGYSGGILCVWDPNCFVKENVTISDNFVAVRGTWVSSATKLMIVSIYAPQWFNKKGFDKLVKDSWSSTNTDDSSKIILLKKKFQTLKASIKSWCKEEKQRTNNSRSSIQEHLSIIDKLFDSDMAQKAKVRWAVEGDENTKFFHGIVNIKRSQLAIRGVLIVGAWIDKPCNVKNEFFNHFANRFASPSGPSIVVDNIMFKQLTSEQVVDLECDITYDEIKRAVWDCGTNKSPGPNGFTFDFIRTFWNTINEDIVNAVREFFNTSKFPPGCNSSFIALIPKKQDAKFVKDFRTISLIGCFYKIIAKILANYLNMVISDLINFEKAFEYVRRDYLDGILSNFGFGTKWKGWIQSCLSSARGSILINGSPTLKFQFHKGLKQGDPLSPYLFILVMESLHLSFNNILNAGIFKGIRIDDTLSLSHLFYADDAIFIGKWERANVITIVQMLKCFFMASSLQINIHKSKLMGIGVSNEEVNAAVNIIGCATFSSPFTYLGVKVGMDFSRRKSWDEVIEVNAAVNIIGCATFSSPFTYLGVKVGMDFSRRKSWDEVIGKISTRLSKWKIKTLSVGGRLTLIKSVLTSLPLYHMSLYKALLGVLHDLETLRRKFFNGIDKNERKVSLIGWNKILASKQKGGLGVSSFYALNRSLLFKWVWRFLSQDTSLLHRLITSLYGKRLPSDGNIRGSTSSPWYCIIKELGSLSSKGINLLALLKKKMGNDALTFFWKDFWINDTPLNITFPRLYALENMKNITVAEKLNDAALITSFRRVPRGGVEDDQFVQLARTYIDNTLLPDVGPPTRWVKVLFGASRPRMDLLFDEIVSISYSWCSNRRRSNIDWISWMKYPRSLSM